MTKKPEGERGGRLNRDIALSQNEPAALKEDTFYKFISSLAAGGVPQWRRTPQFHPPDNKEDN
jgi:hypothetical protein